MFRIFPEKYILNTNQIMSDREVHHVNEMYNQNEGIITYSIIILIIITTVYCILCTGSCAETFRNTIPL